MKKIIVTSSTGSYSLKGELHESGVIVFENGEVSHALHEKQLNKSINLYVEPAEEEMVESVSANPKRVRTKK